MMTPHFKQGETRAFQQRLKDEFANWIDPRLRAIIVELSDWMWNNLGSRPMVITCLNRNVDENKSVGGVKWSAHLVGRAVDFRSRIFNADEIKRIVRHVEKVWGTDFVYVCHHDVGSGQHVHMNIRYKHHRYNYTKEA